MGRSLALSFPPVREHLAAADALFAEVGERPLSDAIYPPPAFDEAARAAQEERLRATALAQPAIGALSAAMFDLLRQAGFAPDLAAGHSFGELTALWAAGALHDDAFRRLARVRGAAMTVPPGADAGAMLAVAGAAGPVGEAVGALDGVVIANVNAPDQTVIAGPSASLAEAQRIVEQRGLAAVRLPVAAAFHTPLVRHALEPFADAVRSCPVQAPRIPVFANATGEPYPEDAEGVASQLAGQLVEPVQWASVVEGLYAAGARVFVEVGPRAVLTGLVHRILGDRPHAAVALDAGREHRGEQGLLDAMVQLRVLGLRLGDPDPYRRSPDPDPGRRPGERLTIRLNGANHVSEKTRKAYGAALARRVSTTAGNEEESAPMSSNGSVPEPIGRGAPALAGPDATVEPAGGWLAAVVADGMAELHAQQRELLRLQGDVIAGQIELGRAMLQQDPGSVLDAVQRQQAVALQQHEAFVGQQTRLAEALLAVLDRQVSGLRGLRTAAPSPLPAPAPAPAAPASIVPPRPATPPELVAPPPPPATTPEPVAPRPELAEPPVARPQTESTESRVAVLQAAMLEVVSEKTGYPVETLELEMDMEADLGIDSIKRVEILGAMQARFTDLPELRPDELAALRTLQEVVDYVQRQSPVPAQASQPDTADVRLAVPGLRSLPPPDALDAGLPAGHCVVLTDDGTAFTAALAGELLARSWPTVVLRLPASLVAGRATLPAGTAEAAVDVLDEDAIGRVLDEVTARNGPIGTFIHLNAGSSEQGIVGPGQEALLRAIFLVTTHLRPSLEESARLGRGSFVAVLRLDGALGTRAGSFDPAAGGLFGLAKSVRQEWPTVFCRAIDIEPSLDAASAARIVLAELADPDERLIEVAYGAHGRVTLVAQDVGSLHG
jgi:acyl transferase domain-containing protein